MKKFLRLLLFGFLSWFVTFAASVCLFALRKSDGHLFELLMGIVMTACTVAFTIFYFRKINSGFLREGIVLGAAFLACNLLFDLPMFSFGPMRMPLARYLKDIGLAYLNMPIIAFGVGYILQRVNSNAAKT